MKDPTSPKQVAARLSDWCRVWEERGTSYPQDEPIGLDGFDHGAGKLSPDEVAYILLKARDTLGLNSNSRLLEVGCGAGMLLGRLATGIRLAVGCDLAESMVRRLKRLFRTLDVLVADAAWLPYETGSFDAILIHSVFQYFPSYEYGERALEEGCRVCRPGGRLWIADVPDLGKQDLATEVRQSRASVDPPRWHSSVAAPLEHRYYEPSFFTGFCGRAGHHCQIEALNRPDYLNSMFRFNVLIKVGSQAVFN